MKRSLLTGVAALFLATGTAHAVEYQGNLPKPVQKLPAYPPVVCVAPNWATESCQERQETSAWPDLSGLWKFLGDLEKELKAAIEKAEKACGTDILCKQKDILLVYIKEGEREPKFHVQKMDRENCSDFLSGAHKAIISQEQVVVKFVDRSVTGQVLAATCTGPDGTWMGYGL
jgi:hypothetical protein